ncbi:TonB-dependent receptor [Bacteroides sp. GD17]|jgi:hypothetical protein|uniref:TonB-dependent receptor n=1 Tax=Bacteroides sp. GD17 TaxID=3139826 RepID=UPI0025D3993B|nr:TonB-dependent receptor [uncultured Bacteroides sp.]
MKKLSIILGMLFLCISLEAANKISGKVTDDSTNQGIEYANVSLMAQDSTFITGAATDNSGNFLLKEVKDGDYILCISCIGYDNSYLSIRNLKANLQLGELPLSANGVLLEGVTITASPVIKKTDRQIILPTEMQAKAASNGLTLLRNLQLSRIIINPVNNNISAPGGENVQLRINGVEVTQAEVIAIRPADVIRIEYIDNPGARYGNVAAVLNYIVKRRESGGNISTDLTNGISSKTGYGEYNLSAKYNFNKSEISTTAYWGRRDLKWTRENYESFRFSELFQENKEIGEPTKVKYDALNFNLNYSYQDNDKQLLNIALRNNYNDTPHSMADRISTLHEGEAVYSISDLSSSKVVIPSLDIYYQRNLKHKQTIYADVVASYLDSKNERTFVQKMPDKDDTDIYSNTKGQKYSIIGEGIYEKQFNDGKFTGGVKHTQAYLQNKYAGNVENKITMNTAETYLFAEYQSKIKGLNYTVGIGAMRTYNSQEEYSSEKYIFKPTLSLSYSINGQWFFRYNGYVSGYAPSLSDLNDISQAMDKYQIRKGNPDLNSVTFAANTLTASWQSKYISVELFGRYSYDSKPIMESTYYEDGHFIRTTENHKGFHRMNLETTIQLRPYKEYIALKITPFLNRYVSYGNAYTHTHTNAGLRGSLMAMYKNWVLMAEMNTSNHTLWGETLTREEKLHTIMAGYNTEKWNVSAGVLNPFTKKYEQEIENLSKLAPYRQLAYSKNLSPMFMINVSFSLDFGKRKDSQGRRINNKDVDTGILSGSK